MKDYNSLEEFIFRNKKYPNSAESRQLYDILWDKYIKNLSDSDRKIAAENDELQNYEDEKANQKEAIERIAKSTERFKQSLRNNRMVISLHFGERWGIYSIYVITNCLSKKKLYKFRNYIPNFFEGWEVKLIPATILQKIIRYCKR